MYNNKFMPYIYILLNLCVNLKKKKSPPSKVTINVKFIFSFYDLHLEITLDHKTRKVDVSLEIPFNLLSL